MIKPDPAAAFTAQIAAAQAHVDARHWIEAVAALERAVILQPEAGGAWRALGDAKLAAGDPTGASTAHDRAARLSVAQAPLADAVAAISANKLATAEQIVRTRLQRVPAISLMRSGSCVAPWSLHRTMFPRAAISHGRCITATICPRH